LESLRAGLAEIQMPQLRYGSKLIGRLPASTAFFASVPNLGDYLSQLQTVFRKKMAESPELQSWFTGRGFNVEPVVEKLRAASEFLGDEIVISGSKGPDGHPQAPVFLAETRREGFAEFLKANQLPLHVETRNGLVAFGPMRESVAAV